MTTTIEAARTPGAIIAPAPLLRGVNNIEVVYDDVILVLRGIEPSEVPKGRRSWALASAPTAGRASRPTPEGRSPGCSRTEDGEVTRGEILFNGERINGIDPDKNRPPRASSR